MFQLWSDKSSVAKELLHPALGLRDWGDVSHEEKTKIWNYIRSWFEPAREERVNFRVYITARRLNELHKYQSYAKDTLRSNSPDVAFDDFKHIFFEEHQDVVLELLSCFALEIIREREKEFGGIYRSRYESDEKYNEVLFNWRWEVFDKFSARLNDVFEQFSINLLLTRSGFIEKQDAKITDEIYVPVLNFLSASEWKDINRDLADAFAKYQLKTEQGYSGAITHAVSALQGYLQAVVYGKTGGTEGIHSLIKQAQEKSLIPDDKFTSETFKNIDTILMGQRGKSGDAHPKQEYANEKNARLVLNLVMIFLQHCIQS